MNELSRIAVRVTRLISYALPHMEAFACLYEQDWIDLQHEIQALCRSSYERYGHCECPYISGDIRRAIWVEETHRIVKKQLNEAMSNYASWIEGECVRELTGVEPLPESYLMPGNDPSRASENEQYQLDAIADARTELF